MEILRITRQNELTPITSLFNAYRQFYGQPSNIHAAEEFLRQRLERDESVLFSAKLSTANGTEFVGFTQLYPSFSSVSMRSVWILNDLYVHEDYRRAQVGQALVKHAIRFAKEDGAVRLSLATAITNIPAQSLYENLGFVRDETFVHFSKTL